jgi:hypothetical protein
MESVTNQFSRLTPETHAASTVLLERGHSEASVDSGIQQSLETFKAPNQSQPAVREPLLYGATGINGSPNLWGEEFQPLEQVTRPTVPTDQAAYYLNRRPQTMRSWASLQNGPIRPIRVNGRLAWRVVDIRAVLSGGHHGEQF